MQRNLLSNVQIMAGDGLSISSCSTGRLKCEVNIITSSLSFSAYRTWSLTVHHSRQVCALVTSSLTSMARLCKVYFTSRSCPTSWLVATRSPSTLCPYRARPSKKAGDADPRTWAKWPGRNQRRNTIAIKVTTRSVSRRCYVN